VLLRVDTGTVQVSTRNSTDTGYQKFILPKPLSIETVKALSVDS